VVCQVDRLCRTFAASIRSVLQDLPESLDKTYEQTLLGIDKEKRGYAQRLFRCLTVSIRPLRVEELAEIFAVQFGASATPIFNPDWRPENAEEAVMSACSSLIAVVDKEGHQIVQFSHFSVEEFLTSERLAMADERLSFYHILAEPAHTTLARASLSVLLKLDDKIDGDAISHFPLARYAARHWIDHAQFGNVSSHIREDMERLFDPAKPHFAAWVWIHDVDRNWIEPMSTAHPTSPEAEPLYYASLCGFRGLVEHMVAVHSPDIHSRGGLHTTPLHAASANGHLGVASLLLKSGADPNSRDDLGRVPLHRISQGGHLVMMESSLEIARLLLDSGADVNVTDNEDWTPIHSAAKSGYREIVEQLLESGANLNVRNKEQETPLHVASINGKLDVTRFLIDRTSDINSREVEGCIPLHLAARYGHVAVARLLIDRGADVNSQTGTRSTPLHLASFHGLLDTAKLLIDHGANIDSRDNCQRTPLIVASCSGHLDVVRFLVDIGAAVSSQDTNGWTPFHEASHHGHLHIIKFLLKCGIDVDIQSEHGETSLCLASSSGMLDVVGFLIENGADIHITDNDGSNALFSHRKRGTSTSCER
jgi:ankyrin repeat protein